MYAASPLSSRLPTWSGLYFPRPDRKLWLANWEESTLQSTRWLQMRNNWKCFHLICVEQRGRYRRCRTVLNILSLFPRRNKVKKRVSVHLSSSRQPACYVAGLDALTSWLMAAVRGSTFFSARPSSPSSICQWRSTPCEGKLSNGGKQGSMLLHSVPKQKGTNRSLQGRDGTDVLFCSRTCDKKGTHCELHPESTFCSCSVVHKQVLLLFFSHCWGLRRSLSHSTDNHKRGWSPWFLSFLQSPDFTFGNYGGPESSQHCNLRKHMQKDRTQAN